MSITDSFDPVGKPHRDLSYRSRAVTRLYV